MRKFTTSLHIMLLRRRSGARSLPGQAHLNMRKPGACRRRAQTVKKPRRARQGRSPRELQSNPAACTPDSRQFLRRGAFPPEKKLLPCSFRARKCAAFQRKLVGVAVAGEILPRHPADIPNRGRRGLLPVRPRSLYVSIVQGRARRPCGALSCCKHTGTRQSAPRP